MGNINCKAFVLRRLEYGNNRYLLELLNAEGKLLLVSAHSSKRASYSPIITQAFVLAEFTLFYHKGRYVLDGGCLIYAFTKLQEDILRLSCAANLAEVYLDCLKQEESSMAYTLLAHTLYQLESAPQPLAILATAQYRLLCELGYTPWLASCGHCKEPWREGLFSFSNGSAYCGETHCAAANGLSHTCRISKNLGQTLSYIGTCELAKLFSFQISAPLSQELFNFVKIWLQLQLEKEYKGFAVLREILEFAQKYQQKGVADEIQ